jgi:hypothetical protein
LTRSYAALRSITQKEPDWNFAKCVNAPRPIVHAELALPCIFNTPFPFLFRYLVSRDGGTVSFFEAGVEPVTLQPLIQQLLLQ